ncbi:MAG: hypothetical protein JJ921_06615 [Pseudomonadales bacterium]|nr:hypothetical protein [Pseudomonadales bacterium]MBO7007138.1 hypothetical protein [Pseudomonadales bacterium]
MTAPLVCWNCGASLDDIPRPISRHANCSKCFEVLHCCRMCRHYMPDKRPYCDHDRAEPPVEKESANFCDYFKPTNRYSESDASKGDRAKSDLDALFRGETVDELDVDDVIDLPDQDDALNKWNDLFDD